VASTESIVVDGGKKQLGGPSGAGGGGYIVCKSPEILLNKWDSEGAKPP